MGNRVGAFCAGSVCPKSGQPVSDHELYDDVNMCDPAGAVFQETLEDLNEVDRLLVNFSSTSNLAVVRWLLVMGANYDACDTNGTTCLHAACRSGSPAVVRELAKHELPLDATDSAGWTALHVALFMGRRTVAVELMQRGADLLARNTKGHTPADLCSDVWLREAIDACAAHRRAHGLATPWHFAREGEEDVKISSQLRFEPFFVPRAPVLKCIGGSAELVEIGVEIFNQRPGQGLAFLVATGCVRDFPVELSNFLSENHVSPAMVGEFLGEDFSLSQTLRLEYINSVRMVGTGVVCCLQKVFKKFHLPSDLHRIDRIVDAVAQIWWRQHEQIKSKAAQQPAADADCSSGGDSGEVEGLSLMKHLGDHGALHQLMLSAVLLHWNLYAPLPPSQRITPARWLDMNAGITDLKGRPRDDPAHESMMKHIQCLIYNLLSHSFYPQLQIWSTKRPGGGSGLAGGAAGAGAPVLPPPGGGPAPGGQSPRLSHSPRGAEAFEPSGGDPSAMHGWGTLAGGSFPSMAGSSGMVTYRQIRGILSETTSSTLATPVTSRSSRACFEPNEQRLEPVGGGAPACHAHGHPALPGGPHASGSGGGGGGDRVWLSARHAMLFLAPKPSSWAPYAFVHLRGLALHADQGSLVLTLSARPGTGRSAPGAPCSSRDPTGGLADLDVAELPQLQLVFLLPDGRWQVIDLPYLQVQLADAGQLLLWRRCLEAQCNLPLPVLSGGGVLPPSPCLRRCKPDVPDAPEDEEEDEEGEERDI